MFTNNPNLKQLSNKIYHYPGFFSAEDIAIVENIINKGVEYQEHPFDFVTFKPTIEYLELKPIWDKVSEFLYPEYVIHPQIHMIEYLEGSYMEPHCDSPGEGHYNDLTLEDAWNTCCLLSWGVCGYFGEWEGGEIYYPGHNNLEISVKPGDLVIHGALSDCTHGVKPITKGKRYVFSNFSLEPHKNPGSFPNYKTEEYFEAIKDLKTWAQPKKLDVVSMLKAMTGTK